MASYTERMNCNCCVFKEMPNCNHTLKRPYSFVMENEKLLNVRDMLVDNKIYQFFVDLLSGCKQIYIPGIYPRTTMLFDDCLLPIAYYYMYPVEYCGDGNGSRKVTVSYIDWREKIYAQCKYIFRIYPRKLNRWEYINNLRIEFIVRHITVADTRGGSTWRKQRVIQDKGDRLVEWFFALLGKSDREIERECLSQTGILVSRRLVDFLKYMCTIYDRVKNYLQTNCQCGGYNDVCTCTALCADVRRLYDENKLCDAVLCETQE